MTKGKMDPRILAVNAILGDTVQNRHGEPLGTITDLMIDLRSGQVIYAYISFGSFGGSSDIADKLFAVPFSRWNSSRISRHFNWMWMSRSLPGLMALTRIVCPT